MSRKEQEVVGLNEMKSRSGCTYEIPMVDHAGQIKLIHAAGVDEIAWLEEGNLPPKLESMFPELTGKTTTLRQKKGEVDVLMGLDNSRWLPRQANNEGKSPGNFRLMKSKFGERYMIMGSDAEMRKLEKIERLPRDALERVRKRGLALTLLLMTGLWSALCHIVLLPVKFLQARHNAQRDPGCGAGDSRLPSIAFADWPPALRRARVEFEKRYRAFLADNERERREHVRGIQAGTRLPPDDERERNMQFWDL